MNEDINDLKRLAAKGFKVSGQTLRIILKDNAMLLAHNPLDVLVFDFDRELKRLCDYLKADCIRQGYLYYFKARINE